MAIKLVQPGSLRTKVIGPRDEMSPPESTAGGRRRVLARDQFLRFGMVWVLILLAILARILYSGFFDLGNLNNLIAQVAPVAIVAVGMTFVIIGGGFDLSVAAIYAVASVTYASFSNHMPLPLAFVLTVLIGVGCGVFNGLVITRLRVNAFIATLASASLFSGGAYVISKSNPVISNASGFGDLGTGKWGGIWIASYVLAAIILLAGIVLARTKYGRSVYALGGNAEAARLAGMRVNWIRITTFMMTGACAAIAGMIVASQTGVGQANIGTDVTLNSIAIVIVGGTSLMGGEGAMWRTLVGILIWGTITNLFSSLALSTSVQLILEGAILLLAVAIDSFARRTRQ